MNEIEKLETQKENQGSVGITGSKGRMSRRKAWSDSASFTQKLQVLLSYLKSLGQDVFHSSQRSGKGNKGHRPH